jgi:hypothetical protein
MVLQLYVSYHVLVLMPRDRDLLYQLRLISVSST